MKVKVLKKFFDMEAEKLREEEEEFETTEERAKELASENNKAKMKLVEIVEKQEPEEQEPEKKEPEEQEQEEPEEQEKMTTKSRGKKKEVAPVQPGEEG